jgi:hypothetical protein
MTKRTSTRSAPGAQRKTRRQSQAAAQAPERLGDMHGAGADVSPSSEPRSTTPPEREIQRVNVDFPVDLLKAIDREAKRIGVTRQAFIKLRLADTVAGSR